MKHFCDVFFSAGTSESEHNSDSGVDHPFSPLLKKGGAFKRDGSADTIDEETNTGKLHLVRMSRNKLYKVNFVLKS